MKNKMKALFLAMVIATGAAFAVNYDKTLPIVGKTITDSKLQAEMMMPIYYYSLRVATADCMDLAIVNTEVTKPKANNEWTETWTVKACTRTARIPIVFTQKADRTDFAIDYMNVKVAK